MAETAAEATGLNMAVARNIQTLTERRRQNQAAISRHDKAAHSITRFAGTMTSAYVHLAVYALWILGSFGLLPGLPQFDRSLNYLGTEASVEAIFLATFVLVSQNRSAKAADRRADLDLHIGLLTEHELTQVATLLAAIAKKLGVESEATAELEDVQKGIAPEAVLDHIEAATEANNEKSS